MARERVRPGRCPAPAHARSVASGAAGFTLLEVLVVVAVMGLALGLVAMRGPTRGAALEMQAATSQLVQALRVARSMAIGLDRPVTVMIDSAARSLRIANGAPQVLRGAVSIHIVERADRTQPPSPLRFNGDGSASGGPIELSDGLRRARVSVDWLTGRVSARPVQ